MYKYIKNAHIKILSVKSSRLSSSLLRCRVYRKDTGLSHLVKGRFKNKKGTNRLPEHESFKMYCLSPSLSARQLHFLLLQPGFLPQSGDRCC